MYAYIYAAVSNRKRKPGDFSYSFCLPFAHRANGSLSFVRLFTKKQTEVIRLQTELTDLPIYECQIYQCLQYSPVPVNGFLDLKVIFCPFFLIKPPPAPAPQVKLLLV
jgi:hypothetical protein